MSGQLSSYSKVYTIGHRDIANLFEGEVTIEEKLDGSQFSFGLIDGEMCIRSKGSALIVDAPEKMFSLGVAAVKAMNLKPGWIYRGEYFQKPKHNALAYSRIPTNHICLFDVDTGNQNYLPWEQKEAEALRLGIDCVPMIYRGVITDKSQIVNFLERESYLGGQKIEGFVVKNYNLFTADKKMACGKFVSEAFKEVHRKEWSAENPTTTDLVKLIINEHRTHPRWKKAIQHLKEAGELTDTPQDIGKLMKHVHEDILAECGEEMKERIWAYFWPKIRRGATFGLPEFYKEHLLGNAFHQ